MDLASSLTEQRGEDREIEELLRHSLDGLVRLLGEGNIDTLYCKWDLANLNHHQGLLTKAEELTREVLQGFKHLFGDTHVASIHCLVALGDIFLSQGRFNEARELAAEALETQRPIQGENDPGILRTMAILARAQYHLPEQREEAVSTMQDCVRRSEQVMGTHPHTKARSVLLNSWLADAEARRTDS